MRELGVWLEEQEGLVAEREAFSAPPFGCASISLDPRSVSPAASFNHNRICVGGTDGGLTREGLDELLGRFAQRGVRRCFVWLSPGPGIAQVREWLAAAACKRVSWTRYPTMMLTEPAPARPHDFDVRTVGVADFAAAKTALGESVFEGYARTLGKPGFQHFIARDGERPIACAALVKFGDIGYLTYAGTVESDRGRGAQSALIAHRVAAARAMGCEHIVSQTLTLLEHSFANLRRAGFREVYEQEVYEFASG
jgi:GNAT superfamily N-acetyltransferase